MSNPVTPMIITVAGPYRSGTGDDPARMTGQSPRVLEEAALPLFRARHIPLIGEWLALPLMQVAGSKAVGDAFCEEIAYPVAHRPACRAATPCCGCPVPRRAPISTSDRRRRRSRDLSSPSRICLPSTRRAGGVIRCSFVQSRHRRCRKSPSSIAAGLGCGDAVGPPPPHGGSSAGE